MKIAHYLRFPSFGLIMVIFLFASCEKELMKYNGVEGIYFAVQHGNWNGTEQTMPFQPFTRVELAKTNSPDSTIRLKVKVTGPIKDYDRSFTIDVIPDSTSAELNKHYNVITKQHVVPAHSNVAYIPITVLRSADLKVASKRLGLRLLASTQLGLSFPEWHAIPGMNSSPTPVVQQFDASIHVVTISDVLPKPTVWRGSVGASNLEAGNWGEYSEKKILLMCELMRIDYDKFESAETMPHILVELITREMAKYLIDRFNAGDPVEEDDGRLMYINGAPWKSYVGVPWK